MRTTTEVRIQQEAEQPDLRARDVMSTPVQVIGLDDSMWHAWSGLVETGHRHLVVCDGHRCVGVLDDRALFAHWPTGPTGVRSTPVRDLLRARTTCVLPDATLSRIARVMLHEQTDAVPVTDDRGHLLGIVTSMDIVAAVARHELGSVPPVELDTPTDEDSDDETRRSS